jgi:uncharacterized membrane protein
MTIPESSSPEVPTTETTVPTMVYRQASQTALRISMIWAILAVILAAVLLISAKDVTYGADAYTGIQNAIMLAVRGIAFLLLGSAALGGVIATRRGRD